MGEVDESMGRGSKGGYGTLDFRACSPASCCGFGRRHLKHARLLFLAVRRREVRDAEEHSCTRQPSPKHAILRSTGTRTNNVMSAWHACFTLYTIYCSTFDLCRGNVDFMHIIFSRPLDVRARPACSTTTVQLPLVYFHTSPRPLLKHACPASSSNSIKSYDRVRSGAV
jgi:hypothetical protein